MPSVFVVLYFCLTFIAKYTIMCLRFVLLVCLPFLCISQSLETVIQKGHRGAVRSLTISHNGKLMASGSKDKTIVLWDMATHKQIRTFNGHNGSVHSVVFSEDDKFIASASGDMTVRIWDLNTGQVVYELDKQNDYLLSLALHPKEKVFAVGGYPFEVSIIDYHKKQLVKEIPCSPDKGNGTGVILKYSRDGNYLVMGEDDKVARVLDAQSYKEVFTMPNTYGSCGGCGTKIDISANSKWVAKLAHNDSLKVYDLHGKSMLARMGRSHDKIGGLVFSDDLKSLYAVADDTLFTYSLTTYALEKKYDLKKYKLGDVNDIALASADGVMLLACDKSLVSAIDLKNGEQVYTFAGINNFTDKGGIDYDPESYWDSYIAKYLYLKNYFLMLNNDRSFVTGKMGKDAIQWNLINGQPEKFYGENDKAVICFDKWEELGLMATGNAAGQVCIWNYRKNILLKKIEAHREPIFNVKFNVLQNQLIVSSWDANISIWDLSSYTKVKELDLANNYSAFCFNTVKGGLYLAVGKLDKQLQLIEPDSREVVRSFVGHSDVVSSISENPETGEMLTSSWDGTARVWDVNSGLMTLKIKAAKGALHAAIYHPDYSRIYTAGADGVIRIWDSKSGQLVATLKGHNAEVTQLQISKDGKCLFSISTDGTLKYWKLDTQDELYEHIRLSSKDWMVKSPTGYFNATHGARGMIGFVKGTELYKLDQFFDKYYRPDLLEKIFNNKVKLGSIQDDLDKTYSEEIKLAVYPDPDGKTAVLYLKIPQRNIHLLEELKISHNGKKLPQPVSHHTDSSRSLNKTVKLTVNLISGMNIFTVHPVSKNKIEAKPTQIRIFADKAQNETNCHIFAIGINEYQSSNMKLRYARADAEAFVEKFKGSASSLYKNTYVHTLYDSRASRRNILDSLTALTRTMATHDVLIFYYAGHGCMVDNMFYLVPQDCQRLYDNLKIESQGIAASELQEIFKKIKALKQIVIMDACQSGGSLSTFAMRGAEEEKAMAQLSRSAGVHIFASAGTEQTAKEVEDLKHGLFTHVLIKALAGDADGSPKDHKVTVYELKSYIDDQVPELNRQYNGNLQYPYTFSLGQDFPVLYINK